MSKSHLCHREKRLSLYQLLYLFLHIILTSHNKSKKRPNSLYLQFFCFAQITIRSVLATRVNWRYVVALLLPLFSSFSFGMLQEFLSLSLYHTLSLSHTHSLSLTLSHTHIHASQSHWQRDFSHTHRDVKVEKVTRTHALTLTLLHTHTHTHAHAHTYTHTSFSGHWEIQWE